MPEELDERFVDDGEYLTIEEPEAETPDEDHTAN